MRDLAQGQAAILMVFMTATDHVAGATGKTLTVELSKNGGAFGTISPTVTERGYGWYALAMTAAHTDTLGDLALHVSATGADPSDVLCIVGAVPDEIMARLAATTIPVNVEKVNDVSITGTGVPPTYDVTMPAVIDPGDPWRPA